MNEDELIGAGEEDYMNTSQLKFFEEKLLNLRKQTLSEIDVALKDIKNIKVSDESDRATLEEETAIAVRIADRKQQLIAKIDDAMLRIKMGDYGYCKQTGEPIGIRRLLLRPTAEYCTDVKLLNEERETRYER